MYYWVSDKRSRVETKRKIERVDEEFMSSSRSISHRNSPEFRPKEWTETRV